MTVAVTCPDRASLERLLEQGAGPDEIERLAGHLETCARFGETVEALLASDQTAAALRGAKVEADAPSVQLLRARLANLRPAVAPASQDTMAGENTRSAGPPPAPLSFEATQDKSVSLAPPQQPDELGRLGGYRILKELGRGGMGVVYKAEDPKLKRLVALKAMLPNLAADEAARQRFLREAQAMAAVHHDHIVVIHAVDEDHGVPFLAMEFLQGMPLDQWLKQGRKPTIPQVLRIGREIAEGLAAAHERGLIHRDIKPGNIWLDSSNKGRVKILDFGLARSGQEDVHLTRTGAIVGTPAYMAPEQARGEKVDARSDLFSLGCVLYKLCTGAMPFAGDSAMALLMALALDTPKPVRELNPDVPAALADLVTKLLAKDPAQRPQSAREVIQALQVVGRPAALGASSPTLSAVIPPPLPVLAPPQGKAAPGRGKRRPWIVAAVATGFLATAIAATVIVIILDKDGNKIAEVKVPPGGQVEVVDDGKKGDAAVAPKSGVTVTPPGDSPPATPDEITNSIGMKLKLIKPGTFMMGSPKDEEGRNDDEGPRHEVEITKAFYMGVYPVTKGQFAAFVKDEGYQTEAVKDGQGGCGLTLATGAWERKPEYTWRHPGFSQGDDHPVVEVSWNDATAFCAWLNKKERKTYELPTEAEWEYACRAGTTTRFWCGDADPSLQGNANVADASLREKWPAENCVTWTDGYAFTSPVGAFKANPWGLYDMGGNVWQWCADGYVPYQEGFSKDPYSKEMSNIRVLRGGSWNNVPRNCRSANRLDDGPDSGAHYGFRVVLRVPAGERPPHVDASAKPSIDDAWLKQVAALPADKQVAAVAAKLKELNPGFDGNMTPTIEGGVVTGLIVLVDEVTDISPVRALPGLKSLWCWGSNPDKGRLADLSPLKGMPLTMLGCTGTPVSDLSPLKGMPLTKLSFNCSRVSDLSPLKGMPLTDLACGSPNVSDLSPLKDMKLTKLGFAYAPVSDLSPLKGMPLTELWCQGSRVSDLSPLKGMPLEKINGKPAAEFWKDVDAKKP